MRPFISYSLVRITDRNTPIIIGSRNGWYTTTDIFDATFHLDPTGLLVVVSRISPAGATTHIPLQKFRQDFFLERIISVLNSN